MSGRTIVVNLYAPPTDDQPNVLRLFADDPVIQLVEGQAFRRNPAQRGRLVENEPGRIASSIFGPTLDWAYREYIVHRLVSSDAADEPLGSSVPTPVDAAERTANLRQVRLAKGRTKRNDQRLYLFNLIVALEWVPNDTFMRQLEWGFRRASDLLYDVSNGTMAFGQVVFGDISWMDCADIQITASNRMLPRSWVGGLHNSNKYMPIRVGRGVWSRRARRAIAWDEPEAYRALVHEWGHYALELRDEYLTKMAAVDCGLESELEPIIVVPAQRGPSESIMATPDGNSELRNPLPISDERFPRLNLPHGYFPGPGRLPLPFPVFTQLGSLKTAVPEEQLIQIPQEIPVDENGVPVDEWSAFVLRRASNNTIDRIVSQGVLDATVGTQDFALHGARPNDRVVIYGNSRQKGPTLFHGEVRSGSQRIDWNMSQAGQLLAAVKPLSFPNKRERRFVNVSVVGNEHAQHAEIFPIGKIAQQHSKHRAVALQTLDGHILLDVRDTPLVLPYSQGGSPWSTTVVTTNPIPAGSNDGDLLLFFSTNAEMSDDRRRRYADVRVVTTTIPGSPASMPDGARIVSKVFGVASNARLDPDLSPTAVFFFDPATVPVGHRLCVYRFYPHNEHADRLPTCVPQGAGYAAVPLAALLDGESYRYAGGTLVDEGDVRDRVEYFQLLALPDRST